MLLPLLCSLSLMSASAGTVNLKTDVALSVERGGVTIGRAPGAGVLPLGDFPPGEAQLRIHRQNLPPLDATFSVPTSGGLMLKLDGDSLTTDTVDVTTSDAPPPVIIFRPVGEQQFSVILNGTARTPITEDTVIEHWEPGTHKLEVRSADNLTIWARGELMLSAGQSIVINLDAGRPLDVQGTAGAWRPAGQAP